MGMTSINADPHGPHDATLHDQHVTETVEQKRARLRAYLQKYPDTPKAIAALKRLLSPAHIQSAAQMGIFISYSRVDEIFALQLADDLREVGLNIWLDITDIAPDADWHREVRRALKQSGIMLLIIPPPDAADFDVERERMNFIPTGKIIIPILHDQSKLSQHTFWIEPVDFKTNYEAGLEALIQLLQAVEVQV